MALDKQINLFKIDTNAFLHPEEQEQYALIMEYEKKWKEERGRRAKTSLDVLKSKRTKGLPLTPDELRDEEHYITLNNLKSSWKEFILESAKKHVEENLINEKKNIRKLDELSINYIDSVTGELKPNKKKIVGMFESTLSRSFGVKTNELTYDIFILEIYYYDIAQDLILNGFDYNGKHYVYFSSSAGQIRKKKAVFVEETKFSECSKKLMCGLTVDEINRRGGMNINKYLAYIALCNSATDLWGDVLGTDFDIDRSIVVDDFETMVDCKVDHIDYQTYEIECNKQEKIPIPHTDGCGIILPEVSKKNFMVRLPFMKGLLGVFDYRRFIKEHGCSSKVKDIWGTEYDIFDDDIQIIFTKSQLKMHKFFDNWEQYKNNFKKYGCEAGICNMEEDHISSARINYQMLQTLYDMTDEEVSELCRISNNRIQNVSNTLSNAVGFFGVNLQHDRSDSTSFQKAMRLYPELITDPSTRNDLRDLRRSYVKKYRGGKLEVVGKFTFVLPDLYAFCEWLFQGVSVPEGLLKNNEVYCRLYETTKELDCLRSPHLYIEHCVRKNVCEKISNNQKLSDWFCTDAIYTSTFDPISKVLQFDVDGDRLLVLAQKKIVEIAKRCSSSVNPLYYEMKKANAEEINPANLYKGLKLAFTGGRIGGISNNITKIWNSGEITEESLKAVKWLCMETNFTIDYAKTLFKPTRSEKANKIIQSYTKNKVPYFFLYAKNKNRDQVMDINDSMMNRIVKEIKDPPQTLKEIRNLGLIDCRVFISKNEISERYDELVKEFDKANRKYGYNLNIDDEDHDRNNLPSICEDIKRTLACIEPDPEILLTSLVIHMYSTRNTRKKNLLWFMYGNELYDNLLKKLPPNNICSCCGKRTSEELVHGKCSECRELEIRETGRKMITCIECGEEFEINKKDTKTCRCEGCRQKKRLFDKRRYWNARQTKANNELV